MNNNPNYYNYYWRPNDQYHTNQPNQSSQEMNTYQMSSETTNGNPYSPGNMLSLPQISYQSTVNNSQHIASNSSAASAPMVSHPNHLINNQNGNDSFQYHNSRNVHEYPKDVNTTAKMNASMYHPNQTGYNQYYQQQPQHMLQYNSHAPPQYHITQPMKSQTPPIIEHMDPGKSYSAAASLPHSTTTFAPKPPPQQQNHYHPYQLTNTVGSNPVHGVYSIATNANPNRAIGNGNFSAQQVHHAPNCTTSFKTPIDLTAINETSDQKHPLSMQVKQPSRHGHISQSSFKQPQQNSKPLLTNQNSKDNSKPNSDSDPQPQQPSFTATIVTERNPTPLILYPLPSNITKADLAAHPVVFAYHIDDDGTSESIARQKTIEYQALREAVLNENTEKRGSLSAAKKRKAERESLALEGNTQYKSKFISIEQDPTLPIGWMLELMERRAGETTGRVDKYWYSPLTKRKFRSRIEVQNFISNLNFANGDENLAFKYLKQPGLLKGAKKKKEQEDKKKKEQEDKKKEIETKQKAKTKSTKDSEKNSKQKKKESVEKRAEEKTKKEASETYKHVFIGSHVEEARPITRSSVKTSKRSLRSKIKPSTSSTSHKNENAKPSSIKTDGESKSISSKSMEKKSNSKSMTSAKESSKKRKAIKDLNSPQSQKRSKDSKKEKLEDTIQTRSSGLNNSKPFESSKREATDKDTPSKTAKKSNLSTNGHHIDKLKPHSTQKSIKSFFRAPESTSSLVKRQSYQNQQAKIQTRSNNKTQSISDKLENESSLSPKSSSYTSSQKKAMKSSSASKSTTITSSSNNSKMKFSPFRISTRQNPKPSSKVISSFQFTSTDSNMKNKKSLSKGVKSPSSTIKNNKSTQASRTKSAEKKANDTSKMTKTKQSSKPIEKTIKNEIEINVCQSFLGPAPKLPKGWILQIIPETPLYKSRYWYSPKEKFRFKGMPDVKKFLALLRTTNGDEKKAYMMR